MHAGLRAGTYSSGVSPTATRLTALLALCLATVAACSSPTVAPPSSSPPPSAVTASPTPSVTLSPSPSPTPTPTPTPTSPLNGEPLDPDKGDRPVLIVKLDNTTYAQPHAGLTKADIVYVEEVEYGITRLAAVFSTSIPKRIGPVRSARITDIDLVAQYGRPAFAYSGAQHKLWPVLAKASTYDVSPNHGASAYRRDTSRRAPYNLYADGRTLLAIAPKATVAHDVGFTFDATPPPGGLVAKKASMRWGYGAAAFVYDATSGLYRVWLNDQRARAEESDNGQNAATVVIQYVKQEPSKYFDKGGGNTPLAHTVGSGKAVVLRDGLAWDVTWSRPDATSGTVFTLPDGSVMPFKPGQTWVVLRDKTRKAKITPLTDPTATTSASGSPTPTATPSPTGTPSPTS